MKKLLMLSVILGLSGCNMPQGPRTPEQRALLMNYMNQMNANYRTETQARASNNAAFMSAIDRAQNLRTNNSFNCMPNIIGQPNQGYHCQ